MKLRWRFSTILYASIRPFWGRVWGWLGRAIGMAREKILRVQGADGGFASTLLLRRWTLLHRLHKGSLYLRCSAPSPPMSSCQRSTSLSRSVARSLTRIPLLYMLSQHYFMAVGALLPPSAPTKLPAWHTPSYTVSCTPWQARAPRFRQESRLQVFKTGDSPQAAGPVELSFGTASGVKGFLKDKLLLGIEPSPDVFAILVVYFVQGALGLARLATTFFLKDDLGLSPAESAALTGIFALPWIIKPFYGFLSDGFPILGYRRRSYMALAGLLGALSWLALSSPSVVDTAAKATIACTLSSLSIAVSDVVADSIVVEKVRKAGDSQPSLAGGLQSLCWGSSAIGSILSAYSSGYLLETLSSRQVFGITAFFPLALTLIALAINESPLPATDLKESKDMVVDQLKKVWAALSQPSVYLPLAFLFVWQGTPSSDSAFFYFLTNEIGMTPEYLGRVRLGASVASLFGVWLYQRFLRDVPIHKVLKYTTIASVPLGLSQLILVYHLNRQVGIPDQWFALGDSVVLTVLGQVAFMPTLVLAAKLCPPGIEGTLFATLMSVFNGAGALGSELGALLTSALGVTDKDFNNLGPLVLLCNLSSLLSLPLLGFVANVEHNTSGTSTSGGAEEGEEQADKGAEP